MWPFWTVKEAEDGPLSTGPLSLSHRCDGCRWGGERFRAVITAAGAECDKQGQMNKREREKKERGVMLVGFADGSASNKEKHKQTCCHGRQGADEDDEWRK